MKRLEHKERLSGVGALSTPEGLLGDVRYLIDVYQEMYEVPGESAPGLFDLRGKITDPMSVDLWPLQQGNVELTLNLEDGRVLDCQLAPGGKLAARGKGIH